MSAAPSLPHDVLLLMLNLSQLWDSERIVQLFLEAINARGLGVHVRRAGAGDDADVACEDIATTTSYFGRIVFDGPTDALPADVLPVLRNAVRILALILENRHQADILRKEKWHLEQAVEQRNELMLRTAIDGFWVLDSAGNILEVNDAYCAMIGYSREALLAMRVQDLEVPDASERISAHIPQLRGTAGRHFETRHRRQDGAIVDLEVGVNYLNNDGGRVFTFFRDVTARKHDEQERHELEAQLRQSQKLEAIGQLAGGIAHDFNNLLTAILGNVELSMDSVRQTFGDDHEIVAALEEIEEAGHRAAALTRQLLTFGRRNVVQPREVSLNQVLVGLDRMLRRLITENISLQFITAPDLATVHADPGQLEQVIVNLVINAVHAMPDGGRLVLETQNAELDEAYAWSHAEVRPGTYALLAVSDTGHGMDAAVREHIFEPFFTTKPTDRGTGLGLSTVHGIVKRVGGHIMVYSEPGCGTTFRVFLPALSSAAERESAAPVSQAATGGDETVLLCEDDRSVRDFVAAALRNVGYTVLAASNGKSCLDTAQSHTGPIDLLLTDVIMPDVNGRVLSERLRARLPGLPTLFASGYTADVIAHHGVLDAGVEFLEKPFTRLKLLSKVRAVLDKTHAQV